MSSDIYPIAPEALIECLDGLGIPAGTSLFTHTAFRQLYRGSVKAAPPQASRQYARDLIRALRRGRAPDGSPYYPAFPYTSYTRMSEADIEALKDYLDTIPPVKQASKPHELSFPFNQRWVMHLWQWLFFEPEPFQPDPQRDAAWNRGAYLVLGPGHCSECHTPRTFYGALKADRAFAGAQLGREKVPNITSDPDFEALHLASLSFTAECWVKTNPVTRGYTLVGKEDQFGGTQVIPEFALRIVPSGALRGYAWDTGSRQWKAEMTGRVYDPATGRWKPIIDDNEWHHVAMVVDRAAQKMTLYVDGVERASSPMPTGFA